MIDTGRHDKMSTVDSEGVEGEAGGEEEVEVEEEENNSSRTHEIINSESKNSNPLKYSPMF